MEQDPSFTEYDALVHSKDIQILKSMLPFVDTRQQMSFAILIQFIEFKNTIQIFRKNKNVLSAHAIHNEEDKKTAMMQILRQYISPRERETFDQMMNMIGIINMMSMMETPESMSNIMNMMGDSDNISNFMNAMGGSDNFTNIMSMMSGFTEPENEPNINKSENDTDITST